MTINIALGGYGKMGKMIEGVVKEMKDMKVVFAVDTYSADGHIPIHYGELFKCVDDILKQRSKLEKPDVWMDFSTAEAAYYNVPLIVDAGIKVLIGTTGFSKEQRENLEGYMKDKVPYIWENNYSLGANVLRKAVRTVAASLPSAYNAGVVELHHNKKADNPSGTADMYKADLESHGGFKGEVFRQRGKQPRQGNEIDMASLRLGTIPGEHMIIFAGNEEKIVLSHTAYSRAVFARGAVEFARKLYELEEPRRYTLEELL